MSKITPDNSFQERLRGIRRWRGFPSGAKAALAFGWSVGSYNVKETGIVRISDEQASIYAKAFGVTERFLLTGHPMSDKDREAMAFMGAGRRAANGQTASEIAGAAEVLIAVRTARGFSSKMQVSRHFGFPYATYKNHEDGRSPIPRRTAELYAFAFDVPFDTFYALLDVDKLPPDILTGKPRSSAEVAAYMKESGDVRTVRDASVDVKLFEETGMLYDAATGVGHPIREQRTVPMLASRLDDGLSADDFAVFRPTGSEGAIEIVVCLKTECADGSLILRLTENSFGLCLGDHVPASSGRKSKRTPAALLLPVVSVSLAGKVAARMPLTNLFDAR